MLSQAQQFERQPIIYVTQEDHRKLSGLLGTAPHAQPGAALLSQELERALIVGPADLPQTFVKLGSSLTYQDLSSQRIRSVRLVLPDDADVDSGRISVFSPVGAVLLGMTTGPTISLDDDDGRLLVLRVLSLDDDRDPV
jgi:regulator of nucleoside diphosphate kinase